MYGIELYGTDPVREPFKEPGMDPRGVRGS